MVVILTILSVLAVTVQGAPADTPPQQPPTLGKIIKIGHDDGLDRHAGLGKTLGIPLFYAEVKGDERDLPQEQNTESGVTLASANAKGDQVKADGDQVKADDKGVKDKVDTKKNLDVQHFDAVTSGSPSDTVWGVPEGVTKITVNAFGAGGRSYLGRVRGGAGAHAAIDLTVTPGETLAFRIGKTGAVGTNNGGEATLVFNGAGDLLAVAAGGGGQMAAGIGSTPGTLWKGAPGSTDCGGGGNGLFGGGAGVMSTKCSGGGGGSSYANTSAILGFSLYAGDDPTTEMSPAAAALRSNHSWGQSDRDGHITIKMYGDSAVFRAGCGMTAGHAAESCDAIIDSCPGATNGLYFVYEVGGIGVSQVYCDLTSFAGGWALAGVYVPGTDGMPTSGEAVGSSVFSASATMSARMSDERVRTLFGESLFLVHARSTEQVHAGVLGSCMTYYRLMIPDSFTSTKPYDAVRCSFDGRLWGASFRPDGYGLTTQSGPFNYAKTSCGVSDQAIGNSSQWVYTAMPQAVDGRDLCVNKGLDYSAHKLLYVRPIVRDEEGDIVTAGAAPNWRLVIPRTSKVACNDRGAWPLDGHPLGLPDHMSLTNCQLACEVDPECTAIDYSPNFDNSLDESGVVRSKCYMHESLAECNNFKPLFSATYNYEVWELASSKAVVIGNITADEEPTGMPDPMKQPCTGSGALLNLTRQQAIMVRSNRLQAWVDNAADAMVRDRLVSMVEMVIDAERHELTGALGFDNVILSEEWVMAFGSKLTRAIAKVAVVPVTTVDMTVVPREYDLHGGNMSFTIMFTSGTAAREAMKELKTRSEDGSLMEMINKAGLSTCVEKDPTGDMPDQSVCVIDTSFPTKIRLVAHGIGRLEPTVPENKESLEGKLRQLMEDELKLLTRTELAGMSVHAVGLLNDQRLSPKQVRSNIIDEAMYMKTLPELRAGLIARVQKNPMITLADSNGCIVPLGFSFCESTQRCGQNWAGGISGPCPGGITAPPVWEMLSLGQARHSVMVLGLYQLQRMRTVDLLEDINADEFELAAEPLDLADYSGADLSNEGLPVLPPSTTCPPHSHDFPRCLCNEGYKGVIDVYAGTGACLPEVCPPNSVGISPTCFCDVGTIGSVSWGGPLAGWLGECKRCQRGTWPAEDGRCVEVELPENAELDTSLPVPAIAKCMDGYAGFIKWVEHAGTYEGRCGTCEAGSSTVGGKPCQPMLCPEMSMPTKDGGCECVAGFEGEVLWNAEEQQFKVTTGSCRACPAGTFKASTGDGECTPCDSGFWSIMGATECYEVPCPKDTNEKHPDCGCKSGKAGVIKYELGYYSGVCEKCLKGYHANAANTACVLTQYPANSQWPSGECDVDYYGAPVYVETERRVIGECTSCGPGYACPKGTKCETKVDCIKVECPTQTKESAEGGHPKCDCLDGEYGKVVWNNSTRSYTAWCHTCPAGEWSADIQKALDPMLCKPAECPVGSVGYPLCRCKPGYVGAVGWDAVEGRWAGDCSKCEQGFWSSQQTDLECEAVGCPEGASGWPRCDCELEGDGRGDDGTNKLTWDEAGGRWRGTCDDKCPPHSAGYPDCSCVEGTIGALTLVNRRWAGSCMPCPEGMWAAKGDSTCTKIVCPITSVEKEGSCICPTNTHGLIVQSQWRHSGECRGCPVGYKASDVGCERVKCPVGSFGHPNCKCLPGSRGSITWDDEGLTYKGNCDHCPPGTFAPAEVRDGECIRSPCPAHAGGWPSCVCDETYEGTIGWDRLIGKYQGECTPCSDGMISILEKKVVVGNALSIFSKTANLMTQMRCEVLPCPNNAVNWPSCVCNGKTAGVLELKDSAWYGECEECKVGFWPNKKRNQCTQVECPGHSSGHPECECDPGYAGIVRWEGHTGMFIGRCVECAIGTYSPFAGATVCLPCPEGTTNKLPGSATCAAAEVACPGNAFQVSDNKCGCDAGYEGTLVWNTEIGEYTGSCTPCMDGWWSYPGSGICTQVACPAGADNHPVCKCKPGYAGKPLWGKGSWEGRACVQCGDGRVPTDGFCVSAKCPAGSQYSSMLRKCKCSGNRVGYLMWDAVAGATGTGGETTGYMGECSSTCPKGYTPNDAATGCVPAECPEDAILHPECTCAAGFGGSIAWDGEKWVGQCTKCSVEGEWSLLSREGNCAPVACPANAEVSQEGCKCKDGFNGALTLVKGVYKGVCSSVTCPRNAVFDTEAEECRCVRDAAIGGRIMLRPDGVASDISAYLGSCTNCPTGHVADISSAARQCVRVACPDGTVASGEETCACVGNQSIGRVEWIRPQNQAAGYKATCSVCPTGTKPRTDKLTCVQVQCPHGSFGWPTCTCHNLYGGAELPFNEATGSFVGRCQSACPKGKLLREDGIGCMNVTCPEGTRGYPNCKCAGDMVGHVLWLEGKGYESTCMRCPPGTSRSAGGRTCNPVVVPDGMVGAIEPRCPEGLLGKPYVWNATKWSPSRSGKCTQCKKGEWAITSVKCVPAVCPPGTRAGTVYGEPMCMCENNKLGSFAYYINRFVGRCYDREDVVYQPDRKKKVKAIPATHRLGGADAPELIVDGCAAKRNVSNPTCTAHCEGSDGEVWRTKQCCEVEKGDKDSACWCVDPTTGSEIPHTRTPWAPYHPMSCKALSCAALDGVGDCVGPVGDLFTLGLSKDFTVAGWARMPLDAESLRPIPMKPIPIFGTVMSPGSIAPRPLGRIADVEGEMKKDHNITIWMGFTSKHNTTLNRTILTAVASYGGFNVTYELPTEDPIETWYHLGMTYKARYNISLYVSGKNVNSTTLMQDGEESPLLTNPVKSTSVHLGAYGDGVKPVRYMRGAIGSVFFSAKAEESVAISATMREREAPSSFKQFSFLDNGKGQPQVVGPDTTSSLSPIYNLKCATTPCIDNPGRAYVIKHELPRVKPKEGTNFAHGFVRTNFQPRLPEPTGRFVVDAAPQAGNAKMAFGPVGISIERREL